MSAISEHRLTRLEDTERLAIALAATLTRGDVIALHGDLGTGKTTFVQYLVKALGGGVDVTSPTFTLLQTYPVTLADGTALLLHHYDLYRIQNPEELRELALEESELSVIEWPQRLHDPSSITHLLAFTLDAAGNRSVTIKRMAVM